MDESVERSVATEAGKTDVSPKDLLGALLSDPSVSARLGAFLGAIGTGGTPSEAAQKAEQGSAPVDAMGDGLGALLQNPAVMERLPQVLAMLKTSSDGHASATPVSGGSHATSSPAHSREHLLLALKPFLSRERCEAVDAILRISQLGDVLGRLK